MNIYVRQSNTTLKDVNTRKATCFDSIHSILRKVSERKFKTLEEKLRKLTTTNFTKQKQDLQFYPLIINKTDVQFTAAETTLL
jgi:hypothetical protein